jgi:hypothetical protein
LNQADLRVLLRDCLALWGKEGRVTPAEDGGLAIEVAEGRFLLEPAGVDMRPVRWFYQTPERHAANRPPRAAASIVAALSALRNAMGAQGGPAARIGPG